MNPLARLARVARIATFVTLGLGLVPLVAEASVRKEGAWPASDKKVSFDFDGKPSDGLHKLAEEAGWSLVVSKGITVGEHDVKIDVEDQPADAVLEALFAESDVVARRSGTLITILPASAAGASSAPALAPAPPPAPAAPAPPAPPSAADGVPSLPPVPPVPTVRGQDRNVFGDSLVVGKEEVVHTVTVTGGSAKIYGTVTGDLVVAGGSAIIEDGGRVVGNATVFGGSLKVIKGARVDGDVGIVGGALKREEGAVIGGKVVDDAHGKKGNIKVSMTDGDVSTEVDDASGSGSGSGRKARVGAVSPQREAAHSFGQSVTNMSLLFVFGCVLLALGTRKMESLRIETAARPMKSFAMGIVGSLIAVFGITALCITVIGIPVAVLMILVATFSVYASIAAVLTTVGAAIFGHKSKSSYVHLFVGCLVFLIVGLIPYVGGFATFALVMVSIGSLVTTRLAGTMQPAAPKPALV